MHFFLEKICLFKKNVVPLHPLFMAMVPSSIG